MAGGGYGAAASHVEVSNRRPEGTKQLIAVLAIVGLGALVVVALVGHVVGLGGRDGRVQMLQGGAQLQARRMASQDPARFQQLWFGPGITDQLNRYVRIGKGMSQRLQDNLKKGLEEQSRMVHLDSFHTGEVGHATGEDDLWRSEGGNNNGGNEPCMKDPGECP